MFNLGPMELVVLAIVAIVVIGPEKLPKFARDAASLLKTVRELATGARQQLRDELGPEFADIDFRNLNPRTAVQRVVFGDDTDLSRYNPRTMMRDTVFGDDTASFRDDLRSMDPRGVMREATASYKASYAEPPAAARDGGVDMTKPARPAADRPRPRPRPTAAPPAAAPAPSYGDDIT